MPTARKLGILLLLGLLLLVGVPTAAAAPSATITHTTVRESVSWTLPAGQCPNLPAGISVSGTGERFMVIITSVSVDGSTRIIINDVVRGTAWDSTGTYSFKYSNHSIEDVPAGAGAHQIKMTDSFVLNGNGSTKHMNVGFNWSWSYTPPAAPFPPVDNWRRISEHGDPLLCDPI
jgi:hypothetical protein